jgi:hypothetical protein
MSELMCLSCKIFSGKNTNIPTRSSKDPRCIECKLIDKILPCGKKRGTVVRKLPHDERIFEIKNIDTPKRSHFIQINIPDTSEDIYISVSNCNDMAIGYFSDLIQWLRIKMTFFQYMNQIHTTFSNKLLTFMPCDLNEIVYNSQTKSYIPITLHKLIKAQQSVDQRTRSRVCRTINRVPKKTRHSIIYKDTPNMETLNVSKIKQLTGPERMVGHRPIPQPIHEPVPQPMHEPVPQPALQTVHATDNQLPYLHPVPLINWPSAYYATNDQQLPYLHPVPLINWQPYYANNYYANNYGAIQPRYCPGIIYDSFQIVDSVFIPQPIHASNVESTQNLTVLQRFGNFHTSNKSNFYLL